MVSTPQSESPYKAIALRQQGSPNSKPDKLTPHLDTISVQLLNIKDEKILKISKRKKQAIY